MLLLIVGCLLLVSGRSWKLRGTRARLAGVACAATGLVSMPVLGPQMMLPAFFLGPPGWLLFAGAQLTSLAVVLGLATRLLSPAAPKKL